MEIPTLLLSSVGESIGDPFEDAGISTVQHASR